MLMYMALDEENALFNIDTAGKDGSISVKNVLTHFCRLLTDCDCV